MRIPSNLTSSFPIKRALRALPLAALLASPFFFAGPAAAQDVPTPTPTPQNPAGADRPWSEGVAEADQEQALKIFKNGNKFFETSQYSQAIVQYREALKSWRHPAIHFNMTVSLINLDQPKEAFAHLKDALKWGPAPLGADVHSRALTIQKLLEKQLTSVTIKSSQDGVEVSLDGKKLFVSPGEATLVALPGQHQLVASKEGYLTITQILNFVGGEKSLSEVELIPLGEAKSYRLERRWDRWKPYAVLGGGAALLLGGVGIRFVAKSDFDRYDNDVTILCPPQGCAKDELPQSTTDVLDRAELEDTIASALLITGAATAVTAGVLLYLNREQSVEEMLPTITPMVAPGTAGVSFEFTLD